MPQRRVRQLHRAQPLLHHGLQRVLLVMLVLPHTLDQNQTGPALELHINPAPRLSYPRAVEHQPVVVINRQRT